MKNEPFIIERTYDAPVEKVWNAITDKDQMKQWYFDLEEFRPEVGFEFSFTGGADDRLYVHLCRVTEVIPGSKLAYSWQYEGHEGYTVVTFELFAEGGKTRLRLTHEGLETLPPHPDFARANFEAGWTDIIGASLDKYLRSL